MKKLLFLTPFLMLIMGCSSLSGSSANDEIIIKSGNLNALEQLHKRAISQNSNYKSTDINKISLALSMAYLKSGDFDNASFILESISQPSLEKDVLLSKVYLAKSDNANLNAFLSNLECHEFNDDCSELYRIKMLAAVKNKELKRAFSYSEKQRLYGGLTTVSRNDLAALHMLSGHYDRAKNILLSILQQDPDNLTAKENMKVVEGMTNDKSKNKL